MNNGSAPAANRETPAPAVAVDALGPAQIEAKAETLAEGKVKLPDAKCFVLAMFAGAFIAFGASFYAVCLGDPTLPFAAQRILGGICFCLGLELVLCCGAELFTGNSLMVCGAKSGRIACIDMYKNWLLVWAGNCAGALVAVILMYLSGLQNMNGGAVGEALVSIAASKASLDWFTIVFKAILCNVFVCLAVWIGFGARTTVDKVIGILLPISAFVAMGFEHCVANMFFLGMGMACKAAGFGATIAGVENLTLGGTCYNLFFATLGNIIGGAVLVGLGYWYVYHKDEKATA